MTKMAQLFPHDPANGEKLVVVGMSGGVDSSVTAAILKQQGYRVVGLFMKNWEEEDEHGVCQASKEYKDVVKVCDALEIPHYSVNFVKEYREQVFQNFLDEYQQGHTPNPDILCNREIKFKVFYDYARSLGADYLATGHYCQHIQMDGRSYLAKGVDQGKDQTYFLYTLKEEVLKNVLFPLGGLQKAEVRELAAELALATKDKKDSTGICFIGERNFKPFLAQYLKPSPGEFVTPTGEVVGEHSGAQFYTIGQRKGLGLGGQGEPWFVVDKSMENNQVIVVRGEEHPALYRDGLTARELSWVHADFDPRELIGTAVFAKNRYRQPDQIATMESWDGLHLEVSFAHPQRALTRRQSIVFYRDLAGHRICLGGGMIEDFSPSYFETKRPLPEVLGR